MYIWDPNTGLGLCMFFQSFTFWRHILALETHRPQICNVYLLRYMAYWQYRRCGPSAHLWDAGGEARQWFSWRAVVELVLSLLGKWSHCLTIVLVYETHVRTAEYTCGLVCTLPCHFLFPGRQMQGRWWTFQRLENYFGVLRFCFSLWRGWHSMARQVCLKRSILLNNPDLRHWR